eukprot:g78171.t1
MVGARSILNVHDKNDGRLAAKAVQLLILLTVLTIEYSNPRGTTTWLDFCAMRYAKGKHNVGDKSEGGVRGSTWRRTEVGLKGEG